MCSQFMAKDTNQIHIIIKTPFACFSVGICIQKDIPDCVQNYSNGVYASANTPSYNIIL